MGWVLFFLFLFVVAVVEKMVTMDTNKEVVVKHKDENITGLLLILAILFNVDGFDLF